MPRLLLAAPFLLVLHAAAQAPEDSRPSLFFREDWKEIAAVAPVTQEHVANPALLLGLTGPARMVSGRVITTRPRTTRTTSGSDRVRRTARLRFAAKTRSWT